MEIKHTPGKWDKGQRTNTYQYFPNTQKGKDLLNRTGLDKPFEAISIGNTEDQVAIIPLDNKHALANAKLIVAAPELLEALKFLMEGVDGLPALTAIAGTLAKQYKQAEKAIKKATHG